MAEKALYRPAWLTAGMGYMVLSTIFFSGVQAIVKALPEMHVFQLVFFRSIVTALYCMTILRWRGISLMGSHHGLLLLRSFFGIIAITLFFVPLQRKPRAASAEWSQKTA